MRTLGRIREADQLVDLGRYIIWGFEREAIAQELRERFCQVIGPAGFDGHQVRYGMLVRVAMDVRNRAFGTDLNFGMSQSGGESKLGLMLAFKAMATSFTKQVLTIDLAALDPDGPTFNPGQQERFETSIAHASAFHAHGFFAVADLLKRLGA